MELQQKQQQQQQHQKQPFQQHREMASAKFTMQKHYVGRKKCLSLSSTKNTLLTISFQRNDLFVYSLSPVANESGFHLLLNGTSPRHFSSPRFSPSGEDMVYLENELRSLSGPTVVPGPTGQARKLMHAKWEKLWSVTAHTYQLSSSS